jgi:cysteine desulfurase family protein (TIGR01976 family)
VANSVQQELFATMRSQFPALTPANSQSTILFDNAAGAQLPHKAISRVLDHLTRHNAQKGGLFDRQEHMQQAIYDLRAGCGDLMGAPADQIALGLNATSLTALVAHHLGRDFAAGDLIVTTQIDHMANIAPWEELRSRGIEVASVAITPSGTIDMESYAVLLARKPRLVACGWVSNATGTPVDVPEMSRLAHAAGALFFVDCVAGAPHLPMDVTAWDVDFAVCSAYKIFGPHLGFLYVNPARLDGWQLGALIKETAGRYGLGTHYGAKLELGTQNHEGIAGFGGTLAYLEDLGAAAVPAAEGRRARLVAAMKAIATYEQILTQTLRTVVSAIPGVILYGSPAVPIISFNIAGRQPQAIGEQLARHHIEARVGNYLAIPQMTRMAADFGGEAVRISLVHYNTLAEIERLVVALRD